MFSVCKPMNIFPDRQFNHVFSFSFSEKFLYFAESKRGAMSAYWGVDCKKTAKLSKPVALFCLLDTFLQRTFVNRHPLVVVPLPI